MAQRPSRAYPVSKTVDISVIWVSQPTYTETGIEVLTDIFLPILGT
jgi:hypothetical protein